MTPHEAFTALSERYGAVQMCLMKLEIAATAASYEPTEHVHQRANELRAELIKLDAAVHTFVHGR